MAKTESCNDVNCFVHGTLSVRGATRSGTVVSDKGKRTVIVERPEIKYISKYKRYARSRSRIPAHCPDCLGAKVGDEVKIAECRKISKTKAWTVVEIIKKGIGVVDIKGGKARDEDERQVEVLKIK